MFTSEHSHEIARENTNYILKYRLFCHNSPGCSVRSDTVEIRYNINPNDFEYIAFLASIITSKPLLKLLRKILILFQVIYTCHNRFRSKSFWSKDHMHITTGHHINSHTYFVSFPSFCLLSVICLQPLHYLPPTSPKIILLNVCGGMLE